MWHKAHYRGRLVEVSRRVKTAVQLRNVEKENPIIVYQMGKVGSSTVLRTLEALSIPCSILQVHTLEEEHLARAVARQRASKEPYLHEHLVVSLHLRKRLELGLFPCRIISLTREPISRAISFVFEDLVKQAPQSIGRGRSINVATISRRIEELLSGENGIADPTRWFDRELRGEFGIDVFSRPYDTDRGYCLLRSGDVTALVLRMEDLNRSLQPALAEFLALPASEIQIRRANVGLRKWYAEELREVRRTFVPSAEAATAVLDTKYARHFYGMERESILARWSANALSREG